MKSEIKISENKTYSKTKILLTTNNFCFIYYVISFVPPQGETGRLRRHVFYLFVHPFVCYQTCEQDILKTNEPLLMHTWGALKMTDMKLQDMKLTDRVAGHEIAGHENGGPNSRT